MYFFPTGIKGTPLLILDELEAYLETIDEKQLNVNLYFNEFDANKCDELKQKVAHAVLQYIKDVPVIGIGTGSTVKIIRQPNHGTVAVSGLVATYCAELGCVGPDNFAYAASDTGGYVDSATFGIVSVTVGGFTSARDSEGEDQAVR